MKKRVAARLTLTVLLSLAFGLIGGVGASLRAVDIISIPIAPTEKVITPIYLKPAAPSELEVYHWPGADSIVLKWRDNSDNETGFIVERRIGSSGDFKTARVLDADVTQYTVSFAPEIELYFRVKARGSGADSDYSNVVSWTAAPAEPGLFTAKLSEYQPEAITLKWVDWSKYETKYIITKQYSNMTKEIEVPPDTEKYVDTEVKPDVTYRYRVKARGAGGDSTEPEEVSINFLKAPSDLKAYSWPQSYKVTLQWKDNSSNEAGFRIEWFYEGEQNLFTGQVGPNVTEYKTDITPNKKCWYRVRAYSGDDKSCYCYPVEYTAVSSNTMSLETKTPESIPGAQPLFQLPGLTASRVEAVLKIGSPSMLVNGDSREIDPGKGTAPVIVGERTMVPARAIVESLGGTVGWDGSEQKVTIRLRDKVVELWIGRTDALVNDTPKITDAAPQIINDRTMLPLRFVSENLGCTVNWDQEKQSITISSAS